jgi:hypothetical protein
LLGEPTFLPDAREAVWTLARRPFALRRREDPDRERHRLVTILVDDVDAHMAEIVARGLDPDERLMYSNGVRKAVYRDPDGNELGFGRVPVGAR